MFLNFKQMIFQNYPEEYKDEFTNKIEHANYLRGKYITYIQVLGALLDLLASIYFGNIDGIKLLHLIFFILSVACAILFTVNLTNKKHNHLYEKVSVHIEVIIVIAWSASLMVQIPDHFEMASVYSIVISSIAVLLFLRWQITLIYFSVSSIYIMIFSSEKIVDPAFPSIITFISVVIVAWVISRLLYKKEIDNFVAGKLLEEKSLEQEENRKILMEANMKINIKTEQLLNSNELLVISEQKAQLANSVKIDFLARMSHDMRTPLTALIGLSEFGIEEHRDYKDVEYFTKIKDSSEYLLSIVNDTLDLQKLESSNIELKFSIEKYSSAAQKVLTMMSLEADARGINLVADTESSSNKEYIMTDEKRVEQILINILSNAIKYTPKGGTVTWVNTMIRQGNESMIVRNTITDNGVGMSQEFTKHMYEPFSKECNSLSNGEVSTGLGLAICKNLIETMGGTIECESELGKGTKFTIDIPHKYATKEEIDTYLKKIYISENIKFSDGKKALICEDSNINAQILSKLLTQVGIVSEFAENGKDGIKLANENDYDVIFMDIKMPVMDGLTAAEEIRKFDKKTPIIALSANAYKEDVEKSIEAGMNAHLSKPFNKKIIFEELSKQLKNK